jgi:hypothetical protein
MSFEIVKALKDKVFKATLDASALSNSAKYLVIEASGTIKPQRPLSTRLSETLGVGNNQLWT